MDWNSLASFLTSARARAVDPSTGQPAGQWQTYNPVAKPEMLAGSPQTPIGRVANAKILRDKVTQLIAEGRFDEADAIQKQYEALVSPTAIP